MLRLDKQIKINEIFVNIIECYLYCQETIPIGNDPYKLFDIINCLLVKIYCLF